METQRYSVSFVEEEKETVEVGLRSLHVIDLSPIFYKIADKLIDRFTMDYIRLFLDTIYNIRNSDKNSTIVVCTDSPVTVKYQLYGGAEVFKKNRSEKTEVFKRHRAQFEMGVTEICKRLGISKIKIDGYEADDLIYATVKNSLLSYDRIIIHSSDSDMFFMIDDKVSVDRGKWGVISIENFDSIAKKDSNVDVPYNAAPFYTIYVKNKDNRGRIYVDRYRQILQMIKPLSPLLFTNAESVRIIAKEYLFFDENEMQILNLALPTPIQSEHQQYLETPNDFIDQKKLVEMYINARNNYYDGELYDIYQGLKANW